MSAQKWKSDRLQPLITIGLSVYNGEATLACAVQSVIAQSYQEWELVLIDDGSCDASLEVARTFTDQRIVVVSDSGNRGLASRLNQAIRMARGKYFCRMDQDDIAFPNRLERQLEFLEEHLAVDLVASSVVVFRNDGSLSGVLEVPESHLEICRRPWNGFYLPHPTWMGRTEWFLAHPYTSQADGVEDQFLLYSTCRESRFGGIPEVLLGYREHRRLLRKNFWKRILFWRVIGSGAIKQGHWIDLFMLCIAQPLKIAGDVFNAALGIDRTWNGLGAVSPLMNKVWLNVWRGLSQHEL